MRLNVKFNSIRTKIFIVFIFLIGFSGILIAINKYLNNEKQFLSKKLLQMTELESSVYKALHYQGKIFLKDFTTEEFYEKDYTFYQLKYRECERKCRKLLRKINCKTIKKSDVLQMHYNDVKSELEKTDDYFARIIRIQHYRGFKNAGMEGRMRNYAHRLEDQLMDSPSRSNLLQLRRHEKDFFLRGDSTYAEKFRLEGNQLMGRINSDLQPVLQSYIQVFDSIVMADHLTGIRTKYGYNSMLNMYSSQLLSSINGLSASFKEYQKRMVQKIDYLSVFALIVFILSALLIGIIIANSITNRVRTLSNFMNHYVSSKFKARSRFEPDHRNDEISTLIKNFEILENEITVQFEKYKYKVNLRTEEILKQKTEIEKQHAIIALKNEELVNQNRLVDFQNHHILQSLKAAKELQRLFFPSNELMKETFDQYYLKFDPLDIVSGDFYWCHENEHGIYIAVADCTGHGAHGALMSIHGINLLNLAVKELKLVQPNQILNYLSEQIYDQFTQAENIQHTMDMALVRINSNKLFFAGANRNILLLNGGELQELKGDRKALAHSKNGNLFQFKLSECAITVGMRLIMYTDGLTDQFGGYRNKKFKKSYLEELLRQSASFSTAELFEVVHESYESWKQQTEQTDDLTLFILELHEELLLRCQRNRHQYADRFNQFRH